LKLLPLVPLLRRWLIGKLSGGVMVLAASIIKQCTVITNLQTVSNRTIDQKSVPAPSTDTSTQKGPEPKLKLDNNLVTALAALDKVLQTSTHLDDDEEKDFA